jgi:hypothetical protein
MTNPLPLPFLLLLQVIIGRSLDAASMRSPLLDPPWTQKGGAPEAPGSSAPGSSGVRSQDSHAQQVVQRGQSATHYSGSGQLCVHAQLCLSVQLCIQGLGDAACSSAGVLILILHHTIYCWQHTSLEAYSRAVHFSTQKSVAIEPQLQPVHSGYQNTESATTCATPAPLIPYILTT